MDYRWVEDKLDEVHERLNRLEAMIPKSVSASSAVEHENKGESMATKDTKRDEQLKAYRAEASERVAPAPPAAVKIDRVTLECAHRFGKSPREWDWWRLMELRPGESVRVVEETAGTDMGNSVFVASTAEVLAMHQETVASLIREREEEASALREMWRLSREACYERAAERDAAIRDREELRSEITSVRNCWGVSRFANDVLKARVAELEAQLESVADRAAAAETALDARTSTAGEGSCDANAEAFVRLQKQFFEEWNGTAPAASGGVEGEPDCWAVENDEAGAVAVFTIREAAELYSETSDRGGPYTVVPRFRAPPQPRGWLTEEQRDALRWVCSITPIDKAEADKHFAALRGLRRRSTTPEVVLPRVYCHGGDGEQLVDIKDVRAAIAAAGVAVKEVGRE